MFRSDRDALATEVEELRAENERLRNQNQVMRAEILEHLSDPQRVRPAGNIYSSSGASLSAGERLTLRRHQLKRFPIWALVALSIVTVGVFPFVHFGLMHGRLPKADPNDPSAERAIGFWFLPCFNLYWLFWAPVRLVARLNLQFRLRGLQDGVSMISVFIAGIATLIPEINRVAAPIAWMIAAILTQRAVNKLADLAADEAQEEEAARADQPARRFEAAPVRAEEVADAERAAAAEEEAAAVDPRRMRQ